MEYITIKGTDLNVSRLCLGGCPMGGYGWGKVEDTELINTIRAALHAGITMFDNADTYGLGHSEEILGKGLAEHRKHVVIATKFGVRVENGKTFYDNSPKYIKSACERSLKRLGTDYIDLYQVHYRDGITPVGDLVQALEGLKAEGKIRYYGLSNIHSGDVKEYRQYIGSFVSVQNEYSLACRKYENDLTEMCKELQLTPLTWGSLGQGILTGKYDESSLFGSDDRRSRDIYENFHGKKLIKNMRIVDAMKPIAERYGVSVAAVAVRFILDQIPDSIVLAGAKKAEQILGSIESMGWCLSGEEVRLLDEISRY